MLVSLGNRSQTRERAATIEEKERKSIFEVNLKSIFEVLFHGEGEKIVEHLYSTL